MDSIWPLVVPVVVSGMVALLLSYFTTVLTSRSESRRLTRELQDSYMKSIFDNRIAIYAQAWTITGKLSSRNLLIEPHISPLEVDAAIRELHDLYNTSWGLLMSSETRGRYFALRELCWDLSSRSDMNADNAYSEIWLKKMDLRNSLRVDVFLEPQLLTHTQEERFDD